MRFFSSNNGPWEIRPNVAAKCGTATDECKATSASCAATSQLDQSGVEAIIQGGLQDKLYDKHSTPSA